MQIFTLLPAETETQDCRDSFIEQGALIYTLNTRACTVSAALGWVMGIEKNMGTGESELVARACAEIAGGSD